MRPGRLKLNAREQARYFYCDHRRFPHMESWAPPLKSTPANKEKNYRRGVGVCVRETDSRALKLQPPSHSRKNCEQRWSVLGFRFGGTARPWRAEGKPSEREYEGNTGSDLYNPLNYKYKVVNYLAYWVLERPFCINNDANKGLVPSDSHRRHPYCGTIKAQNRETGGFEIHVSLPVGH